MQKDIEPRQLNNQALYAIIYTSRVNHGVSENEILHILESAKLRNKKQNITGLLISANGCFMQYIEGPEQSLLEIYSMIKAHPMHHDLVELMHESIDTRAFPDWSMAYIKTQVKSFVELTASLRARHQYHQEHPSSTGAMILHQFWNQIKR